MAKLRGKHYSIHEIGEIIIKNRREQRKEILFEFNWMWKAYLRGEYTQQQFVRMFRKKLNSQSNEKEKEE